MKYIAVGLLVLALLAGNWQRKVRRGRGDGHHLGGVVLWFGFGILALLTGAMQAGARVGKGGMEISASSAEAGGFVWMVGGAWAVFMGVWGFVPETEDWAPENTALLFGIPVATFAALLSFFDVP